MIDHGSAPVVGIINRAVAFAAAALLTTPAARAADVASNYHGAGAGLWSDAARWRSIPDQPLYPNNGNGGLTFAATTDQAITLDVMVALEHYTLAGGVLGGVNYRLSVTDGFTFSGGVLSSNVDVLGGNVTVTGANPTSLLSGGTIRFLGNSAISGTLKSQADAGAPSVIEVGPGAALELGGTRFIASGNVDRAGELQNHGTVRVTATSLNQQFDPQWRVHNAAEGTFAVGDGASFSFAGGFDNFGRIDVGEDASFMLRSSSLAGPRESLMSGTIAVAAGGTLGIAGNTMRVQDATFSGPGTVAFTRGNVVVATPTVIPNPTRFEFATVTVNAPLSVTGAAVWSNAGIEGTSTATLHDVTISSRPTIRGAVTIPAGGTLATSGNPDLVVLGGGAFTVDGYAGFTAGTISAQGSGVARVVVGPTGVLVGSPLLRTLTQNGVAGTGRLENAGLVGVKATSFQNWSIVNSGTILADTSLTVSGPSFESTGRLESVGAPGLFKVDSVAADVSGSLRVTPAARFTFNSAATALHDLAVDTGGTVEFAKPATWRGAGTVRPLPVADGEPLVRVGFGGSLTVPQGANVKFLPDAGAVATHAALENLDTIVVDGGSLTLAGPWRLENWGKVRVANGGTLNLGPAGVAPRDGGRVELARDATPAAATIKFDGSATPLADVRGMLLTGYDAGAWTGPGIALAPAAAPDKPRRSIGYGTAAQWHAGGDDVEPGDILLRAALPGDADLNGAVEFADLVRLAQNYEAHDGSRVWTQADFNYDGHVTFTDLVILAQNYNATMPAAPIPGAPADFRGDVAAAFAAVPEPGMIGVIGIAAICLKTRRRRR